MGGLQNDISNVGRNNVMKKNLCLHIGPAAQSTRNQRSVPSIGNIEKCEFLWADWANLGSM